METVNIYSGAFHSDSFLENEKWSLIALIIPFVAASAILLIVISSMFVYGSRPFQFAVADHEGSCSPVSSVHPTVQPGQSNFDVLYG